MRRALDGRFAAIVARAMDARAMDGARARGEAMGATRGRELMTVGNSSDPASVSSRARARTSEASIDRARRSFTAQREVATASRWNELADQGVDVNPCNSPKHPAALAGVAIDASKPRRSLQEAYDPLCVDFVSGHAHVGEGGIGLKTFRCEQEENVCESKMAFPAQYEEIPGIVAPAMFGVAASAHGNWAASIALMDRAILPRPPLVTLKSLRCDVLDVCAPGEPLTLRSSVLQITDQREPFRVIVAVETRSNDTGKVLSRAECAYEKIGAVRSMR